MKAVEVRAMSADERREQILSLKKELLNLRFQQANGREGNTARVRQIRRDIARIKTVEGRSVTSLEGGT